MYFAELDNHTGREGAPRNSGGRGRILIVGRRDSWETSHGSRAFLGLFFRDQCYPFSFLSLSLSLSLVFSLRSETLLAQTSGPLGIRAKRNIIEYSLDAHQRTLSAAGSRIAKQSPTPRRRVSSTPARRGAGTIPRASGENSRNLARAGCTGVRRCPAEGSFYLAWSAAAFVAVRVSFRRQLPRSFTTF
jgi:hypothetical protein